MIDFTRTTMTHFTVHFIGNKGLGEETVLNEKSISFKDDFIKETTLRYLLSPFKNDVYYQFKNKIDISLGSVSNLCEDLFNTRENFIEKSKEIAIHLYNQSMHPKIKGGEFYVCYFKDVVCDGELVDAIGLFKTENKQTFLKVYQHIDEFDVDCDNGINISKLDKGCLIFNTEKGSGYKLSIIDNNNKVAECALYWEEDFLNAKIKPNSYYHTKNFIDTARGFCEEILIDSNNVSKQDQNMMLNTSVSYFKDKDKFNVNDFEREVLKQPAIIEAFRDYKSDFNKRMDIIPADEFDVSVTAVKKNKKFMRTIVKLDNNFHIYIHARHDYLEKGFDEEKGLKYYKIYYVNEY